MGPLLLFSLANSKYELIAATSTQIITTAISMLILWILVRKIPQLLPHIEAYRAKVPLYPGADFGFYLYSRDGVSLRHPVSDYQGRHYDPDVHQASFALPKWQRDWLGI